MLPSLSSRGLSSISSACDSGTVERRLECEDPRLPCLLVEESDWFEPIRTGLDCSEWEGVSWDVSSKE